MRIGLLFTVYGFLRSVGAQAQAESCLPFTVFRSEAIRLGRYDNTERGHDNGLLSCPLFLQNGAKRAYSRR